MNELKPVIFNEQRILTTAQIAEMYGTDARRISENFNSNKDRYLIGKDYYALEGDAKREFLNHTEIADGSKNAKTLYLWTEHGALIHAKSLGTDKAWEVYGELVDTYFRVQEQKKTLSAMEMMKLQFAAMTELDARVETLEEKVEKRITLDCGQQRTLQNIVSKRAYERAGQVFPNSIRENSGKFFHAIYKDLKNRFGVASYRDINANDYTDAIHYIQAWIEPAELRKEVA